jgi:microcystin degradation protein MlrC
MSDKKLKVAFGGFVHETNTFATKAMGKTELDGMIITRGQAVIDNNKGTNFWGGFLDVALENGWEIAPTTFYFFEKSFGLVSKEAYAEFKADILAGIKAAMPLDAVFLANHGAGVAEGTPDLEGSLVAAVRELVGPDVKLISTLDLHGKCTEQSVASYDFVNGCLLYPHTDINERNRIGAELLPALLSGEVVPTLHCERVPLAFPVTTTDEGSIAFEILELAREIGTRDGVLDCSVLHGFPYQDSEFVGMTVMVTTDNNNALAEQCAKELGAWIWENRERTIFAGLNTEQALSRAGELLTLQDRSLTRSEEVTNEAVSYGFVPDEDRTGPVVICEYGDNPGSGAAGDTTHLLRAMMEAKLEQACMLAIRDPETVQQALEAGVGATINVRLGGKLDHPRGGDPIECEAYVKSVADGKIRGRGVDKGMIWNVGPTVRLIVGGIDVVLISTGIQAFDDCLGRIHGIVAEEYRVVAVKSANHFRAYYNAIACEILVCDTPGLGAGDVRLFEYTQIDYSVFPHDADAVYPVQ